MYDTSKCILRERHIHKRKQCNKRRQNRSNRRHSASIIHTIMFVVMQDVYRYIELEVIVDVLRNFFHDK